MPKIIIMEGPDGCGKTEIGKVLSHTLLIPYFKVSSEKQNWRKGKFKEALEFDQTYISEFIEQVKPSVIIDRAWPSEFVYSKVFKRETNHAVLRRVDDKFAELGAVVVLCLRRNYEGARIDELVQWRHLHDLHDGYLEFAEWTRCKTVTLYVDDLNNDIDMQIPALLGEFDRVGA